MYKSPFPVANVTIVMAFDLADFSTEKIKQTHSDFSEVGLSVNLATEWTYPVHQRTWIVVALSFLGGVASQHYAEKFFDALDRLVIQGVQELNVMVNADDRSVGVDIDRANRDESIRKLDKAIETLQELRKEELNQ